MKFELNKKINKIVQEAWDEILDILKFNSPHSAIEAIIEKTTFENSYRNLNPIQQLDKK
jgi:hypothetical protein